MREVGEYSVVEVEGLDKIFIDAGFEWRQPDVLCLAMNDDRIAPQERCASTSNRNFEGRQGTGGRTHLVSPATAAAAIVGHHDVSASKWVKVAKMNDVTAVINVFHHLSRH